MLIGQARTPETEHDANRVSHHMIRARRPFRDSANCSQAPLITVVIPCYNQARFLAEAIESTLSQTYPNFEVIVVDDGSVDDTSEAAALYGKVRLIRQENTGLSGARNRGLVEGKGEYVVFLDADDRLLPDALEVGVRELEAHPDCAFVSGHCTLIAADGSVLQTPPQFHVGEAHYRALLQGNYIWNPASVMYRRAILDRVGGFDTSVNPTADYDLYLRLARDYPVRSHDRVIVEARRHSANMSSDYELMMEFSLSVLHSQWNYARRNKQYEEAYKQGIEHYRHYYGELARHQQLFHRIGEVVHTTLPPDATVIVVGNDGKGVPELDGRRGWRFPQFESGASERLFAQGTRGSEEAPWIETGKSYEFRLYAGTDHTKRLATVTVTRSSDEVIATAAGKSTKLGQEPVLTANLNPVPTEEKLGKVTVSWSTGDDSEGQVYVCEDHRDVGGHYVANDEEAIAYLEAMRMKGGEYVLFPAISFCWLEHYVEFRRHLIDNYSVVVDQEDTCLIFALRDEKAENC